jgi:hypothetical protein
VTKLTGMDKVKRANQAVKNVGILLENLSIAFYDTGNVDMYRKLAKYSGVLDKASENIEKGISEKIHADYALSVEATANILSTALAVGEMNRNEKQRSKK